MEASTTTSLTIFGTVEFCRSRFAGAEYSLVYIGGNGVLASLAAAKHVRVDLIGVIGADMKRKDLAQALGPSVRIENVEQIEGDSFYYQSTYDPESFELVGEEIAFGVYGSYSPVLSTEGVKSSQNVLSSGSNPRLGLAVLKQMRDPHVVAVNTLLYHLKHNGSYALDLVKSATHLFTNAAEYDYLADRIGTNLFKGCKNLRYIFKTKGVSGTEVITPAESLLFPLARVVRPLDPINAGDVFAGTVMGMIVGGHDPEQDLQNIISAAQEESIKVIMNDEYYRKKTDRHE